MSVLRTGLGAVVALAIAATSADAQSRPRIAVVGFENNTTSNIWGDKLGDAAADELTSQLVRSGKFTVLERAQIQKILDEQAAGQSGAIDPATAAQIGKVLGAQVVLLGSITQFSVDQKSGGIGRFSASYAEAESMLDVRIVNVNTAEIIAIAEGQGKKRFGGASYDNINLERSFDAGVAQEALRPAVEKAIDELVGQLDAIASVAPAAAVMQIVGSGDGSFYIDRGENAGLRVGQRLDVMRVTNVIRGADGSVLDEVTDKVGTLEITRVLSQSAICKVVDGEAKEGDKVKPAG